MAPGDRLRGLQMREAWHHPVGTGLGLRQGGADQRLQPGDRGIALVANPQAEVRRHLVVAAAGGVQPARGLADHLAQAGLDIHVNVLEVGAEAESAALDL